MRIAYFILLSLCFSSCRLAKQSVSPIQPETDFAILVADNHEIWVKKQDCLDYFHKLDSQKHDIKNVTQLKYALESYTPCKFGTTNSGAPKIDSITTNSSFDETKLELFGVLFNLVFKLAKRHKIYVFDFTTKQWVNYHTKLFKGLHGKSIEIIDENGKTILYYMLAIANATPQNSMNMNGLDLYDFHARQYDPVLGRFTTPDPLSEKYYHLSPYAYCASNPLRYIDPTGKVLIFVNGMHFGDGGTSEYWNGLDKKFMSMLNDNKSIYYDGSGGGVFNTLLTGVVTGNLNPYRRMAYGSTKGYSAAAEIISNLGDGETIKFVTHSMGAAYCKGFISGMQKYAAENGIDISGKIVFELDLAPFQSSSQKANPSVKTMTISHYGDIIAGHNPIEGAKNNTTKCSPENSVLLKEHSISSFTHDEINRVLQKDNKSTD